MMTDMRDRLLPVLAAIALAIIIGDTPTDTNLDTERRLRRWHRIELGNPCTSAAALPCERSHTIIN